MPRPRKGYHFTRQASGQIVYKYIGPDGRWHAKRVPMRIGLMVDAVEWVRQTLYGRVKLPGATVPDRVARLRALAERTDNPNERAAALLALGKLGAE